MEQIRFEERVKIVDYGDIIDYFHFTLPPKGILNKEKQKQLVQEKSLYRSKMKIQQHLMSNKDLNKFITLTFRQDITYKEAIWHLKLFTKKLRYRYNFLKYLAVIEVTKNNRYHFHIICNIPYVSKNELFYLWGQGFIQINFVKDTDFIASYITKYFTKSYNKDRIKNRKVYFVSNNLTKPNIYINEDVENYLNANFDNLREIKQTVYNIPFIGSVLHIRYMKLYT